MKRVLGFLIVGVMVGFAQIQGTAFAQSQGYDSSHLSQLASSIRKALEQHAVNPNACAGIDLTSLGAEVNSSVEEATIVSSSKVLDLAQQTALGYELLVMRCSGIAPETRELVEPRIDSI